MIRRGPTRRALGLSLCVVAAVALGLLLWVERLALRPTAYWSGWSLLALVLFLTAYNARKKLTYPPLGSSATWLQLHVYGGLLCVVVYFFHTGLTWPNGVFENLLALLFLGVAASGIAGIFISRLVPRRLTLAGGEVIYERIPAYRQQLREAADVLVQDVVDATGATVLAEHYAHRISGHLRGVRDRGAHLRQSNRPLRDQLRALGDLDRFLNEDEKAAATQLEETLRLKDQLDKHAAMQGLLKTWLFVHLPLTYAMLLCVAVHVLLALRFGGESGAGLGEAIGAAVNGVAEVSGVSKASGTSGGGGGG